MSLTRIKRLVKSFPWKATSKCQSSLPLLVVEHDYVIPTKSWVASDINTINYNNSVRMLEHSDFIIDYSIIVALRKLNPNIAKMVEYDAEISDGGLLPLNRMDEMMEDRGIERPPITANKSGRLYEIINGRHRFARSLLLGHKIPTLVLNDGRDQFLRSGGESNPGPSDVVLEMQDLTKPNYVKRNNRRTYRKNNQKHQNRYKQSLVPKDQVSNIINKVVADSRAPNSYRDSNDNLSNSALSKNRKGNVSDGKERGRCDFSFGDELVHSIVQQKIDAKTAAKIITEWDKIKPTREDLELMIRKSKCGIVYDCPCSKINYGFPNCGCDLKEQFIAFYNKIVAIEDGVIIDDGIKVTIPVIEQKPTTITCAVPNLDTIVVVEPSSEKVWNNEVIVRERKGLFKYLKTPGVFSFRNKFNHHHESIAKVKNQAKANFLVISDDMIIDDLYSYLRRNEFEEYPDRKTKLAHMTKLAAKWDQGKFKLNEQGKGISTIELNKYFVTIQKVTDAKDTEFLLQEVDAYHSNNKRHRFLGLLGCFPSFHRLGRLN